MPRFTRKLWWSVALIGMGVWTFAFLTGIGYLQNEQVSAGLRTCNYLVATGTDPRVILDEGTSCKLVLR